MCTSGLTHPHGAAGGLRMSPLKQQEPGLGGDGLWTQRAWRCLCSTPHQQGSLFLHGEPFRGSVSPRMMYQAGLLWLQLMKIPCPNQVKEKRERENTRRMQRKYPRMRRLILAQTVLTSALSWLISYLGLTSWWQVDAGAPPV